MGETGLHVVAEQLARWENPIGGASTGPHWVNSQRSPVVRRARRSVALAAWADLPDPPDELKSRRLPILEFPVQSNQQLFRCHKRTRGPIYFNRTEGRFGPPDGASFGMCYFGMDAGCAFLEGLMDHVADGTTGAVVSMSLIRQRCICAVTSSSCLLYTSDAADDLLCVDLGGRR